MANDKAVERKKRGPYNNKISDGFAKQFGNNLTSAIEHANITQKELAKAISVNDEVVSKWCAGKQPPNMEQVAKIAKYLNVSADTLIGTKVSISNDDSFILEVTNYTGISEDNIKRLHASCNDKQTKHFINTYLYWLFNGDGRDAVNTSIDKFKRTISNATDEFKTATAIMRNAIDSNKWDEHLPKRFALINMNRFIDAGIRSMLEKSYNDMLDGFLEVDKYNKAYNEFDKTFNEYKEKCPPLK